MEKQHYGDNLRIAKYLASQNIGSRREIEKFIQQKRIKVNGTTINSPITFVSDQDNIQFDNRLVEHQDKITILKFIISSIRTTWCTVMAGPQVRHHNYQA